MQKALHEFDSHINDLPENQEIPIKQSVIQCDLQKQCDKMKNGYCHAFCCESKAIKPTVVYANIKLILSLPSRTTMQLYMDSVRADCGVSQKCLNLLKEKVSTLAERHDIVNIDEIKLRVGIKFNMRHLKLSGLIDLSECTSAKDRKDPVAYGLVFMYRPFKRSWTQLPKEPIKSAILSKLKVILASESLNLWLDAVVCDGGATNRGMWKEYGISGCVRNAQNSMQHPCPPPFINAETRLFFYPITCIW